MPSGAKPKQYPADRVAQVGYLYSLGLTQSEVAAEVGTTQKVVWNIMRRNRIAARVAAKRDQWGANNHAWKDSSSGVQALHRRLYSRFGKPTSCAECGTDDPNKSYDYANLTGNYADMADYKPMCRGCHWKYDGKITNIKHMREEK